MFLAFALAAIASHAGSAPQEIRYEVSFDAKADRIGIAMTFRPHGPQTTVQMPSWSPGLYIRQDYWKSLDDVVAVDETGNAHPAEHPRGDTWTFANGGAKTITVRYTRPVDRSNEFLGMFSAAGAAIHYAGPRTYLYVVDRKEDPCSLTFRLPPEAKIAVGLAKKGDTYMAPTYDDLADAPVTFGDFIETSYRVKGKLHQLIFRGSEAAKMDRDKVTRIAEFISKSETDFFGVAPYPKYVWHIMAAKLGDNAGGVEHLNGTDIFVGDTPGPGALHGMAHEFFHLFNVKRIREKVLGPFDYAQLPKAGSLWWLEGVTDYYSYLIPYRAGASDQAAFLREAMENVAAVRSNKARLEVSPFESGFRIPESVSRSSGYRVNYYPTGWVLGMLFDIELRVRTAGKHSLDDVERALWEKCKDNKPGFETDEIRNQLIRFGGAEMGPLYDVWVLKPGELPVEATLAKIGLALQDKTIIPVANVSVEQGRLRDEWLRHAPLVSFK